MPVTYEPIATQTISSATASFTFSSIPSTYTDLVLVINSTASVRDNMWIRCNGDTGTNYSYMVMTGTGTAARAAKNINSSDGLLINYYANPDSTPPDATIVQFNNYSNTTTFKTAMSRANRANVGVDALVSLWRSSAAINSLTLRIVSATISTGSTFSLYGIKAA